jgi:uncharacterized protein with GYD domain
MKTLIICVCSLLVLATNPVGPAGAAEQEETIRYFMFSSRPNADAWQFMIENPGDRQAATAGAIEEIGGEMLGYYWSLKDARNYIIVALPDSKTVMAMLIQRLSSGLLHEYEATELLLSSDMPAVFERLKELNQADSLM